MKGAFAIDSKFYRVVEKAGSLIVLNLLWLVCSLPVVTLGAASCALYDTAVKISDDKEGHVAQNFLNVFRRKWKQASKLWLILLVVGIGLCFNLFFWRWQEGAVPEVMTGLVTVLLALWFLLAVYGLSLTARMETPVKVTLRNAALLTLKYLPQSFYMLLCTLVFFVAGWLWSLVTLAEVFAGMAVLAVVYGRVLERIFERELQGAE